MLQIIDGHEECSMCMNYFKISNREDLKIVKSNIESVISDKDE